MIGSRSVLGVVVARGGSKGIPRKNLAEFRGSPLIEWTIRAGQKAAGLDRLILSSDDPQIIEVAQALGCEVPFRRPDYLATDMASSVDVMLHAAENVPGYDIVVLLQPTSPLRIPQDIEETLRIMQESSAPGCVSVCEAPCHPYLIYRTGNQGALYPYAAAPPGSSLRRQALPPAFRLNGAVYAVELDWLKRERAFVVEGQTAAYVMPLSRSIDIDTLEDIEMATRQA